MRHPSERYRAQGDEAGGDGLSADRIGIVSPHTYVAEYNGGALVIEMGSRGEADKFTGDLVGAMQNYLAVTL